MRKISNKKISVITAKTAAKKRDQNEEVDENPVARSYFCC